MPSELYLAVLGVLCTQLSFLVLYFRGIMYLNRDFSIVDLVEKLQDFRKDLRSTE